MASVLCSLGHVATTRQLLESGVTQWQLHRGGTQGEVARPRRGLYACSHLDAEVHDALAWGGAITCTTVLRRAGVWSGHDRALHVQVAPKASGKPSTKYASNRTLRLHWEHPQFDTAIGGAMTVRDALWRAIRCLDTENAIAALESAGHERLVCPNDLAWMLRHGPRQLRRAVKTLELGSGSGNETIVRLRLQQAGYRVKPQGHVPGLGHQDLVVEDCVGIEVDGRRWHGADQFAIDRDRDLHSEGLGRHTLRLRTSHIFNTWPHTLAVIDRVVADALALRRGRGEHPHPS